MKHLVLCFTAFLMFCVGLQAQSKKELESTLQRDLASYRKHTLALDFDSSLQFMPPKMFDLIPKDSLKVTMMNAMNNEYMSIQMTGFDLDPKQKMKIKKAGDYHWTYVPYTGSMRMVLKGDESFTKILVPIMKSQFGSENVQMQGDSIMDIRMKNKKLLAFKDSASATWSLIEDKRSEKGREGERQKMFFTTIMPEEVLKAIDKK